MYTCILCGGESPLADMASNKPQTPSYCKLCYNHKRKENKLKRLDYFRAQDRHNHKLHRLSNPEKVAEYERAQRSRNSIIRPEAIKAVNTVNNDLKSPNGILIKSSCEICGAKAQAHHEDYSKPLEVIWLCPIHHKQRHKEIKEGILSS